MNSIIQYIKTYFLQLEKKVFLPVTALTAILIFINYHYSLDDVIRNNSFPVKLLSWYTVFAIAFTLPYFIYRVAARRRYGNARSFFLLLALAPALFALKLTLDIPVRLSSSEGWNNYWNHILYWPLLVLITGGLLWLTWRKFDKGVQPFYGIRTKNMNWSPYLWMLLIMVPLIAAASTQPDFLEVYPKLQSIKGFSTDNRIGPWHQLLFELSYGSDFITIELFFRGFLILAFMKWAGRDAILPMACFYCTIHFGKPLAECISSYFGGMLLGIVVYNTRSIFGGLIVHLGIAWMMELGGYLGNSL